ncbi:AAEL005555-PA, partial [Aedes aegypti]
KSEFFLAIRRWIAPNIHVSTSDTQTKRLWSQCQEVVRSLWCVCCCLSSTFLEWLPFDSRRDRRELASTRRSMKPRSSAVSFSWTAFVAL